MNFLANSNFHLILPFDQLDFSEDKIGHISDLLSYGSAIIPIFEGQQTGRNFEKLVKLFQDLPPTPIFLIIHSEQGLNYLINFKSFPNINVGVYVPTDLLIHHCIYFSYEYNFGKQIDLLRRLYVLNLTPFAICDGTAVNDIQNYLELVAQYSQHLYFMRNSSINEEIIQLYDQLSQSTKD